MGLVEKNGWNEADQERKGGNGKMLLPSVARETL